MTAPTGGLTAGFARLPGAFRAALWFLAAGSCFVLMLACARKLSGGLNVLEIIFWRAAIGFVIMLPWLARRGLGAIRTTKLGYHVARTSLNYAGLVCTFYAATLLPLADITAISFSRPIVATLLAILVLGEASRGRRWLAIAVGFAGTMIIVRPGFAELNPGVFLMFGAVLVGSGIAILAKYLVTHDPPDTVAMYLVTILTALSLGPALVVWQTPSAADLPWLAAMGVLGTASQRTVGRAYQAADASVVVSFDFLRLPIAALAGFLFFAEVPDVWVWLGAGVICVSSLLLARREAATGG